MPRAEVGTPKYVANKMKSKGLQRLRWYCQVCEKQCRDENGFKCHSQSEGHLRQMLVVGENAGRHIADFSSQFQSEFVALLSRRFGTKRVKANTVYQEYIQDKQHLHMNATRWVTMTEFVKHLGRTGVARVDETEKGWFLAWVDNSPKALAKQEAALKKERLTVSDEQRERVLIAEQIERAGATEDPSETQDDTKKAVEDGLQRSENADKVVLSLSLKPSTGGNPSQPVAATFKSNPFKGPSINSLKRPNALKPSPLASGSLSKTEAASVSIDTKGDNLNTRKRPVSSLESIIYEEEQRKKRKMERDGHM